MKKLLLHHSRPFRLILITLLALLIALLPPLPAAADEGESGGVDGVVLLEGSPPPSGDEAIIQGKEEEDELDEQKVPPEGGLEEDETEHNFSVGRPEEDEVQLGSPQNGPTADNEARIAALLDNIAKGYVNNSSEWVIMDMAAYAAYKPASTYKTTAAARQAYVDYAINSVADPPIGPYTSADYIYAKAVLGLRAVGINPTDLLTVNKTALNAVAKLKTTTSADIYNASYVLLAYRQGNYSSTVQENALVKFLLAGQQADGRWKDNWGDMFDADATAMVVQGLAPYAGRAGVQDGLNKAVAWLDSKQGGNGSFGSSNTDAMVLLALNAAGVSAEQDARFTKNGVNLVEAMLSYALRDNSGFGYLDNSEFNDYATEQCFRALISLVMSRQKGGSYNIYDFSANALAQGVATSTGGVTPGPVTPPAGTDIKVKFTLCGLDAQGREQVWIDAQNVMVTDTSKVYHVIIAALKNSSYTQVGAETGYVSSITRPGGAKLSEFDYGPNSGWLYKVNDYLPEAGMTSYRVADGDHVLLYYSTDWTLDPDAGNFNGNMGAAGATAADVSVKISAVLAKDGQATALLSGAELNAFVAALAKSGDKEGSVAAVTVDTPQGTSSLNLTLPQAALLALGQTSNTALLLQSGLGEVKFNAATLAQLITAAGKGDLTLTITVTDAAALPEDYHGPVGERPVYAWQLTANGQPVGTFKGLAELFLPYAASPGEDINKLAVYHFFTEGAPEKIKSASYHSGRKGMLCSTGGFSLFAVAYEQEKRLNAYFADVPASHWAAAYVYQLAGLGVISGKTPTLFAPEDKLTRAELAVLLNRLSGETLPVAESLFDDVADTAWYASALTWAVQAGIIQGVGERRFAPQQPVSRQDLALMLMRYAAYKGISLPQTEPLRSFTDDAAIAAYAREAVTAMQRAGICSGYEDGGFHPAGQVSRAEAAKMLALLCK